jgi:hypothetical protein
MNQEEDVFMIGIFDDDNDTDNIYLGKKCVMTFWPIGPMNRGIGTDRFHTYIINILMGAEFLALSSLYRRSVNFLHRSLI